MGNLERRDVSAVSPTDTKVVALAPRLGWRPETLARRINAALPAPMEQMLYFRLSEGGAFRPESVAKILRGIVGPRPLDVTDMVDVVVGDNLHVNRFAETLDLTAEVIAITRSLRDQYGNLSIETATSLAVAYGPDHVEDAADSLLQHILGSFDIESDRRLAMGLHWLAHEGLERCHETGCPYPLDVGDWLASDSEAFRRLHRYIGFPTRG